MTLTDFPDEISPFPDAGGQLYGHQIVASSPGMEFRSSLPLQKLRPIRYSGGDSMEFSNSVANFNELDFLALAASSEIDLQSQLPVQKLSPECYDSPANVDDEELLQDKSGGSCGVAGNRWPEEETLALLKIRSEMEAEFRNANPRGPLWEIVSRKLGELGFHRDSKQCREKFKNTYTYFKKTKRQAGHQSAKTYKFFGELEGLHNQPNENPSVETEPLTQTPDPAKIPIEQVSVDFFSDFSSSDDDDSLEGLVVPMNRKRKRKSRKKLKFFFEKMMKTVIKKQEEMHKQLIDVIEKRENDRIIREEAWKQQEMERMKRDRDMRAQESSRSLALISFIQNILHKQIPIPQCAVSLYPEEDQVEKHNQPDIKFDPSSNRWSKSEVQALVMLRTVMDNKFQSVGSKGSVWEEVSLALSSMDYNRSAKKCREKWENINKYFKRTMGSGKKHSENSKTCPYFQELDILYKNRLINVGSTSNDANNEDENRSANEETSDDFDLGF